MKQSLQPRWRLREAAEPSAQRFSQTRWDLTTGVLQELHEMLPARHKITALNKCEN